MSTVVVRDVSGQAPTFAMRVVIADRPRTAAVDPAFARSLYAPQPGRLNKTPRSMPTFGEFAAAWLERQMLEGGRQGNGLAHKSREDVEWRLSKHLLPAFAETPLDGITREAIDDFRLEMVRGSRLGATSINKLLFTLSAVLQTAVEHDLIARNAARGRRRRLVASVAQRSWIGRADHIAALLNAAEGLDRNARVNRGQRRALLATLVFAGLRIGEALSVRWGEIDLPRRTLAVRSSKTEAGLRIVNLLPVLRDDLVRYRASRQPTPDMLVFGTSNGRENGATNVRRRVLAPAVDIANGQLRANGVETLPERLTPHSLRRTFASLLFAIGESPPYVMAQMGHTTPGLTLAIYAREMNRRDGEPERLRALVNGGCVARTASTDLSA